MSWHIVAEALWVVLLLLLGHRLRVSSH
jgi:hypothetical protein